MNSGIKISAIKTIRIALFSLFMLMFGGNIIVKYIENVKSRSFFYDCNFFRCNIDGFIFKKP